MSSSRKFLSVPLLSSRAAALVPQVAATLSVGNVKAKEIVAAFERHAAEPLRDNLAKHVVKLASDDFWRRVSGVSDFRAHLIQTTAILSGLITARAASEVARIQAEAEPVFGDASGNLDLAKLADPPPKPRRRRG